MKYLLLFSCLCVACTAQAKKERRYGKHNIAALAVANNGGNGLGISYEIMLNDKQNISLLFPIAATATNFEKSPAQYNNAGQQIVPADNSGRVKMYFFAPGIRFYPTGSKGIVRYSFGGTFAIGSGQGSAHDWGGADYLISRTIYGVVFDNAVYVQPIPQLRITFEFYIGPGYDDQRDWFISGVIYQASIGVGYRFGN
ncbi:MAG: hypothetical protein ACTHJ0_03790 [Flavipsychrobacter sp.]